MIFDTHFSEKESIRYGVVDGTATIVKYEGDEMRVVIPASIDGFKVTKIEPYAFSEKSMKYIQFPDTLEVIDHHGFSECRELLNLDFPDSLKSIGNYAFYNCWALEQVHLTAHIRSIGFGAFKNCEKLSEIVQDKIEGLDISIGSILDDLNQQIHVIVRHLYSDKWRRPELFLRSMITKWSPMWLPCVSSLSLRRLVPASISATVSVSRMWIITNTMGCSMSF